MTSEAIQTRAQRKAERLHFNKIAAKLLNDGG
jgi:hypothetical protein